MPRGQKKLDTMAERARALAQEMVLFGNLKGSQWDGLAACLVVFAGSEISRYREEMADELRHALTVPEMPVPHGREAVSEP